MPKGQSKKTEKKDFMPLRVGLFAGAWTAIPLLLLVMAGWWLDTANNTRPLWTLIGVAVAFTITIFGLFREYKKMVHNVNADLEKVAQQGEQKNTTQTEDTKKPA